MLSFTYTASVICLLLYVLICKSLEMKGCTLTIFKILHLQYVDEPLQHLSFVGRIYHESSTWQKWKCNAGCACCKVQLAQIVLQRATRTRTGLGKRKKTSHVCVPFVHYLHIK